VCRVLERNGFELRRHARHGALYAHPEDAQRRTLVPERRSIPPGTLRSIIKHSGKTADELAKG
jgi:predicted RNA binding protein YcfA (HicA-like mRNA interferase family)